MRVQYFTQFFTRIRYIKIRAERDVLLRLSNDIQTGKEDLDLISLCGSEVFVSHACEFVFVLSEDVNFSPPQFLICRLA